MGSSSTVAAREAPPAGVVVEVSLAALDRWWWIG
jgi:hypothetical protein